MHNDEKMPYNVCYQQKNHFGFCFLQTKNAYFLRFFKRPGYRNLPVHIKKAKKNAGHSIIEN